MRLAAAVALIAITLSQVLLAAFGAPVPNPEEVHREVARAANITSATVIDVRDAIEAFRELARCAPPVEIAAHEAIERLKSGDTISLYIYYRIFSQPWSLSNCSASLIYRILVLSASIRVGNIMVPSNLLFLRGFVLQLLGFNKSMEWMLSELRDPRAWAALGALILAKRIDENFWRLVAESPEALCLSLLVGDGEALHEAVEAGIASKLSIPPYGHPYSTALRYQRDVCTRGLTRLYALLYNLPAIGSCRGSQLGHIELWNIVNSSLVCLSGRLYPDIFQAALASGAKSWREFEARCEQAWLSVLKGGSRGLGAWALLCSRDPLIARLRDIQPYSNQTIVNWVEWGHLLATRLVNNSTAILWARGASVNDTLEALYACLYKTPRDLREAGFIARLASLRRAERQLLADLIALRVCAALLSQRMGLKPPEGYVSLPPPDPRLAWLYGYLWTREPPRDNRLIREALLAWRLALQRNMTRLASMFATLAESLAEGDYTRALNASRHILDALGVSRLNPGLARLASRLASLTLSGGNVRVNLTLAALLYSRLTGVPLDEARGLVSDNLGEVLASLTASGLNATIAKSIVESLPMPRTAAERLESLVERASQGDTRAYLELIRLARLYGGVRIHPPPRLPSPTLPSIPLPERLPIETLAAAVAAGSAAIATTLASRRLLQRATPEQRLMARVLALLALRGYRREPSETLREFTQRLPHVYREHLLTILPGYERARYGGVGGREVRNELKRLIRRLMLPFPRPARR